MDYDYGCVPRRALCGRESIDQAINHIVCVSALCSVMGGEGASVTANASSLRITFVLEVLFVTFPSHPVGRVRVISWDCFPCIESESDRCPSTWLLSRIIALEVPDNFVLAPSFHPLRRESDPPIPHEIATRFDQCRETCSREARAVTVRWSRKLVGHVTHETVRCACMCEFSWG